MNCNQCFWLQIVAWCCSLSLQQVSSATFSGKGGFALNRLFQIYLKIIDRMFVFENLECNFNTFKNFQSAVRFSINVS